MRRGVLITLTFLLPCFAWAHEDWEVVVKKPISLVVALDAFAAKHDFDSGWTAGVMKCNKLSPEEARLLPKGFVLRIADDYVGSEPSAEMRAESEKLIAELTPKKIEGDEKGAEIEEASQGAGEGSETPQSQAEDLDDETKKLQEKLDIAELKLSGSINRVRELETSVLPALKGQIEKLNRDLAKTKNASPPGTSFVGLIIIGILGLMVGSLAAVFLAWRWWPKNPEGDFKIGGVRFKKELRNRCLECDTEDLSNDYADDKVEEHAEKHQELADSDRETELHPGTRN